MKRIQTVNRPLDRKVVRNIQQQKHEKISTIFKTVSVVGLVARHANCAGLQGALHMAAGQDRCPTKTCDQRIRLWTFQIFPVRFNFYFLPIME